MKGHGLKTIDYDADYLWECECGYAGEDLTERDKHLTEAVIATIDAHIPSVTDEMDEDPDLFPKDDIGDYCGDQRICRCGEQIEGYYDYVEHLKEMLA